jgi:hypothetical protein
MGSYSTGKISIRFHGRELEKTEDDGWIFACAGNAFVGVKFLDSDYGWDETQREASPAEFDRATDKSRVLVHAGDVAAHESFERFRAAVLANHLSVAADKVEYRFGTARTCIEVSRYDADEFDRFTLPRVNGTSINLRPLQTYRSPYLNGQFGSDRIAVTVGPLNQLLDFCGQQEDNSGSR